MEQEDFGRVLFFHTLSWARMLVQAGYTKHERGFYLLFIRAGITEGYHEGLKYGRRS